jgi:transposase-like protein
MSGLKLSFQKRRKYARYSEEDKRMMIEEYLHSGLTKREIWKKYTGREEEHGLILYWMYQYGYFSDYKEKTITFTPKKGTMSSRNQKQELASDFETLQLQNRILELEKQLQESEMKSIAWQTMVEIAERELNISIKKKFNTKPSKK